MSDIPSKVYAEDADYVKLAINYTNAKRMSNWLRDAADVYDIGGADKSAEHARAIANRIEHLMAEIEDNDDAN